MYTKDYFKLISIWLFTAVFFGIMFRSIIIIPLLCILGYKYTKKLRIKQIKHDIEIKEKYKKEIKEKL